MLHQLRPEWRIKADEREAALSKRNAKMVESYNENTRSLPELEINDHVAVQNQHGFHPRRWSKTGKIVEKHQNRQYTVRMDGSRRVTLRNRKFLKQIAPVCSDPPIPRRLPDEVGDVGPPNTLPENGVGRGEDDHPTEIAETVRHYTRRQSVPTTPAPITELRRSTRLRNQTKTLCVDPEKKVYTYEPRL